MHLNAQRPIFVPEEFQAEIEKMSKAALMDLAWDFATSCSGHGDRSEIMDEFRLRRDIILLHRVNAKLEALKPDMRTT